MPRLLISLFSGLLFGIGLAVAQMTNPLKVLDFLDVSGDWDPSLAFVMGSAVVITASLFTLILKRGKPFYAERFSLPSLTKVDARLITGAALFGIGWGLTGYCPGPAMATLFSGNHETWLFVPAMLAGGWLQRRHRR